MCEDERGYWWCVNVRESTRGKKDRDEAQSESLHPFQFAAECIRRSDLNYYQFMIALLLSAFYLHWPGGGHGEGNHPVALL